MNKLYIFFIGATGLLYSCHSPKNIGKTVVVKDTTMIVVLPPASHAKEDSIAFRKEIYKGLQNNYINFNTFSGKIDVDYEDADGKKYNVNAHVRMQKDSVIWLSITAILGIEGMRIFITPDSVKIQDKQNKTYTAKSIAFLQELTALPLSLSTLQDLLIGNPVFIDSGFSVYKKADGLISLQSNGVFFKNLFTITEAGKLIQNSMLEDIDTKRKRTCYLTYSNYEKKNEINFSTKRSINVADKTKLSIKMDFKQFEFNEKLSFPFNVPKNYTKN